MTRILFYYPSNKRSVPMETLITSIRDRGRAVELLTTCERGALHERLDARGIPVHAHSVRTHPRISYYTRQGTHLIRFCRSRGITAVFSHLQHANIIAVFAQYFVPARVVIFRHHFHFVSSDAEVTVEGNRTERVFDRIISRLAETIVVPSEGVYAGMSRGEGGDMSRVLVIPYVYDFSEYGSPNPQAVGEIKARYPARLRVLMSSRMVPQKRHALVFQAVRGLIGEGFDIQLLVLDDGPERTHLEEFVRTHALADRIHLLGYRDNVLDFMGACDLLVHPSLTDASSSVVKEMALVERPAVVCEGVGDFGEYIVHGENGYLVPRADAEIAIAQCLRAAYRDPNHLGILGRRLRRSVRTRFEVRAERIDRYLELAESTATNFG
jgi:glycosyltransferase involved in cell wall biosynthesis